MSPCVAQTIPKPATTIKAAVARVADSRAADAKPVEQNVQAALQAEIAGDAKVREAALQAALEQSPNDSSVRWHNGFVRVQGKWIKHDQTLDLSATDSKLNKYREQRASTPTTVEGHLQLADWCQRNKLVDQERAHLTALLDLAPDHAAARRRLGHIQIDGSWLSEDERETASRKASDVATAMKKWSPKLTALGKSLTKSKLRQQAAVKQLAEIDDPAAIPSMELFVSTPTELGAVAVVEALSQSEAPDASLSLARHALLCTWAEAGDNAVEKLKKRDPHSFIPAILSTTRTPWQARMELTRGSGGRLFYRHMLYSENEQKGTLAVIDQIFNTTGNRETALADASGQALTTASQRNVALARQNSAIDRYNRQVRAVLSAVTGADLPSNPDAWWAWWNEQNEVYYTGEKPVDRQYARSETTVYGSDSLDLPQLVSSSPASRHECLAAGTPVWTDQGAVAVEKIRVGDLVLAQHPRTGELAYKPVVRTTIRPPEKLLAIKLPIETFKVSGGHPFWVAGRGWVKARDLHAGTILHAINGPVVVEDVTPETQSEQSYNMVVEGFHSYFATSSKLLSHDNSIREPVSTTVPGLAIK